MKNKDIFYLKFSDNYFYKNDIITTGKYVKLKVLETPHKKWYKQLLQFISFGIYKAPTCYKCEVVENKVQSCKTCRFNCEDDHTCMNDCNVGSYYAEKGLNRICYEGELYEPR